MRRALGLRRAATQAERPASELADRLGGPQLEEVGMAPETPGGPNPPSYLHSPRQHDPAWSLRRLSPDMYVFHDRKIAPVPTSGSSQPHGTTCRVCWPSFAKDVSPGSRDIPEHCPRRTNDSHGSVSALSGTPRILCSCSSRSRSGGHPMTSEPTPSGRVVLTTCSMQVAPWRLRKLRRIPYR